ncbi:tRNA uracil 4-sulfurtransferase ThiI [Halomonas cerina]|uniref:tRNA sulfurtransferase n=1 Tax=Halomonas cerina TaxID=447424 RepID=A0A839UZL6_9GAMM|nr:tRNA uracil 4-sulfurtransferase ThiI [Halomonas cerina]MBB3188963.1 thiamine biosynthesis protein ThiI [Halomonas cerina]
MLYLLKLSPEITIKSRSVRQQMTRCLATNVRNTLQHHAAHVRVKAGWDLIRVRLPEPLGDDEIRCLEAALARIPGIHEVQAAELVPFISFTDTVRRVVPLWQEVIRDRRFRVRVKRRGRHAFSSEDLERHLGSALLTAAPGARVDLRHPDVEVPVSVVDDQLQLIRTRHPGAGGYPLGVQGQALALVSGGFDSPVAAWRMMRRGVKTHFLFFNLGGAPHEAGVREVVHHLWRHHGASHHVRFVSVPFEGVVGEILRTIPDGLMGVVLKRMMVRAASRLADTMRIPVLVTGDAIAQVSSQTLTNLGSIDAASELPILRPLLTEDKQAIIDAARRLDTARFAERMPEYCGVISRRPHVRARRRDIEAAEAGFDPAVLDAALEASETTRVDRLRNQAPDPIEVRTVTSLATLVALSSPCVIDIRPPAERDAAPLTLPRVAQLAIPFYELQDRAPTLPDDHEYLLYCDQGVMSRMQALHLADRGLTHFGIYRGPTPDA